MSLIYMWICGDIYVISFVYIYCAGLKVLIHCHTLFESSLHTFSRRHQDSFQIKMAATVQCSRKKYYCEYSSYHL